MTVIIALLAATVWWLVPVNVAAGGCPVAAVVPNARPRAAFMSDTGTDRTGAASDAEDDSDTVSVVRIYGYPFGRSLFAAFRPRWLCRPTPVGIRPATPPPSSVV